MQAADRIAVKMQGTIFAFQNRRGTNLLSLGTSGNHGTICQSLATQGTHEGKRHGQKESSHHMFIAPTVFWLRRKWLGKQRNLTAVFRSLVEFPPRFANFHGALMRVCHLYQT
jgi:hypothetical protein